MRENEIIYTLYKETKHGELQGALMNIPAAVREYLPLRGKKVTIEFQGETKELTYNPNYSQLTGLTWLHRACNAKVGTILKLLFFKDIIRISVSNEGEMQEALGREQDNVVDKTGLHSLIKGAIGENKIKELLWILSEGGFEVHKSTPDIRGIDLVVIKGDSFHPIYLQVKTRFNVQVEERMILTINSKTFTPHPAFFIVGVSFDISKMDVEDKILFIPSKELKGMVKGDGSPITIIASWKPDSKDKWQKYFINKEQFIEKLTEKFDQMDDILK